MSVIPEKKLYKATARREYPKTEITIYSADPLVELLVKTGIIYGVRRVHDAGVTCIRLDNFEIENHKPANASSHGITFEMNEFWNSYNFHYKDILALLQDLYNELDEDQSNLKQLLEDKKYSRLQYTISRFSRQIGEANRCNAQDYLDTTGNELRRPRREKTDERKPRTDKTKSDAPKGTAPARNNKGREKVRRD